MTEVTNPFEFKGGTDQAVRCDNCDRLSIRSQTMGHLEPRHRHSLPWIREEWVPLPGEVRSFEDVPDDIAQAASEATLCLSVGAFRACGSLARAVVEAIAKDKGITGGNLAKKIQDMEAAQLIRPHIRSVADEIRHFGNGMAHGDFADPVSEEEAAEIVDLMAQILHDVYQSPAIVDRRRQARQAAQASTTP